MGYDVKDIYSKIYIGKCNLNIRIGKERRKRKKILCEEKKCNRFSKSDHSILVG